MPARQYQAAASNPKWCSFVKWYLKTLSKDTLKKKVPIITWKPLESTLTAAHRTVRKELPLYGSHRNIY